MFIPKVVIFEDNSLDYALGNDIYNYFKNNTDAKIIKSPMNRIKQYIPGENFNEKYKNGKRTMVVGVKRSLKFQTCKPSANFQLPLVSGCIGECEYCYLNTQLSDKPYVRVHVNIDEILKSAKKYIEERLPEITIFEGSATSDPLPVEPYTHSLKTAIEFFAGIPNARFRFVTKYSNIDDLLNLNHNCHTEIRFSINTEKIIKAFEHRSSPLSSRLEASSKVLSAGYPSGFIIAPVFIYDNWKQEYHELLLKLKNSMPQNIKHPLTFEIISHRYTTKAKNTILTIFPKTQLPMNNDERQYKYGQFGYGKYIYSKDTIDDIKSFFTNEINNLFVNSIIKYII